MSLGNKDNPPLVDNKSRNDFFLFCSSRISLPLINFGFRSQYTLRFNRQNKQEQRPPVTRQHPRIFPVLRGAAFAYSLFVSNSYFYSDLLIDLSSDCNSTLFLQRSSPRSHDALHDHLLSRHAPSHAVSQVPHAVRQFDLVEAHAVLQAFKAFEHELHRAMQFGDGQLLEHVHRPVVGSHAILQSWHPRFGLAVRVLIQATSKAVQDAVHAGVGEHKFSHLVLAPSHAPLQG